MTDFTVHNDQTTGAFRAHYEKVLEEARNLGPHDLGAVPLNGSASPKSSLLMLKFDDRHYSDWEKLTHALLLTLIRKKRFSADELRRGIEGLEPPLYARLSYYEKWAFSMLLGMIERGILSRREIEAAYIEAGLEGGDESSKNAVFAVGDVVVIKPEALHRRWRKPHLRTPGYLFGAKGVITEIIGRFEDPSFSAFRDQLASKKEGVKDDYDQRLRQPLYRVRFAADQVKHYAEDCLAQKQPQRSASHDNIFVFADVFHPWLARASTATTTTTSGGGEEERVTLHTKPIVNFVEHDGHRHGDRREIEQTALDREQKQQFLVQPLAEVLIALLCRKGITSMQELRAAVERIDSLTHRGEGAADNGGGGVKLGQKIVARAWVDPAFKAELLRDPRTAVLKAFGVHTSNYQVQLDASTHPSAAAKRPHAKYPHGHTELRVIEATDAVHPLVVCTLCSCYPSAILGTSPSWYKSSLYRAAAVRMPRQLLREQFGLDVGGSERELHVYDSTAEARYLVLPRRPHGTAGWSEEQLQRIVTRDSMIGVAECRAEAPEIAVPAPTPRSKL